MEHTSSTNKLFFLFKDGKKYILMKCQSGPYIKIKVKKLKFDLILYNCFLEI